MIRVIAALLTCGALLAAAGCGSSGSSGGSGSKTTTAVTATTTTSAPTSSLRANTTPKYAAPSSSQPVQSGIVQIGYRNIAISPDTVRVRVGSTIRWTNYDSVAHNVTSRGGPQQFASKNFGEGATFEVKATRAGLIHYLCTNHPTTMNGTIEVVR